MIPLCTTAEVDQGYKSNVERGLDDDTFVRRDGHLYSVDDGNSFLDFWNFGSMSSVKDDDLCGMDDVVKGED